MPLHISDACIEKIKKETAPHWGELGWVTYKRTYARWLDDKNRSENWDETVKRVVEGNINLDPRLHEETVPSGIQQELQHEAERLYQLIYGLAATPAGRNLWISGTDYQKKAGDALNNCWFIAIRPQAYGNSHIVPGYLRKNQPAVSMPFSFLFDELMKGGGVGFSVVESNIAQMPEVDQKIELIVLIGKNHKDYDAAIEAGAADADEWRNAHSGEPALFSKTEDSREGWVDSNALLIDAHFSQTVGKARRVVIDVTKIREKGRRIRGFGGTAAGPAPLIEMLHSINNVLNNAFGRKTTSVDCTDICNFIGKNVVAGNVRRSAEIALGSPADKDFVTMKQDKGELMDHRWASNNSVIIEPGFDDYETIADAVAKNGEPGIVNLDLIQNYGRLADGRQEGIDGEAEGTNPCGEISLCNGEPCNLFEVFPLIAEEQGWNIDEVFQLAARYAKRVTFSKYDWEISRKCIYKNRRIGVSISGIQDWVLKKFGQRLITGFRNEYDPETGKIFQVAEYHDKAAQTIRSFYDTVIKADQEYSRDLGCRVSLKHTTVKPSGTVSKLTGVSEGMHFSFDRYIIQRIRFQDSDPLIPAMKEAGYRIEKDAYSENTIVAEFPVKAEGAEWEHFVSANDVSIEEQFATQAFLQTYWADNSVSCTITFHPEERQKIAGLLRSYRNSCKSTSLLPYSGHGFVQAPKEPISKEKYFEMKSAIKGSIQGIYQAMHLEPSEPKDLKIIGQTDCDSNGCPVK